MEHVIHSQVKIDRVGGQLQAHTAFAAAAATAAANTMLSNSALSNDLYRWIWYVPCYHARGGRLDWLLGIIAIIKPICDRCHGGPKHERNQNHHHDPCAR